MAEIDDTGTSTRGGAILSRRNSWRHEPATRVAFLVDARDYYAALAATCATAEESILLVGWDLNSRVRLIRDDTGREALAGVTPSGADALPEELGPFLAALVRRRRRLRVHLLDWDWAMVFALEREVWPLATSRWRPSRRLRFRFDGQHPTGASHHQKIVVVDDRVAFAGGIDVCAHRWDTPRHDAEEPGRVDPWGRTYPPFHDVQMMVEGDVARALGDLARERWQRLTRRRLRPPRRRAAAWPEYLKPDLEHVRVAIARTDPLASPDGVREVEHLYLDSIAAARRWIYVENQYLTAQAVADALAARLAEPDGPEIVIVLPTTCSGWLEEATMGVLRARVLRQLRAADARGRLRVLAPTIPGVPNSRLNVHAKVTIVDDRLVRVGSANLSNRSMGLDTECDLAIESDGEERIARGIASLRARLLAEHLDVTPAEVADAIEAHGSLIGAIDALRGGPRSLVDLDGEVPAWMEALVPAGAVLDPERPVSADELVEQIVGPEPHTTVSPRLIGAGTLAVLIGLAIVLWRWSPLASYADPASLAAAGVALGDTALAPFLVPLVYVAAGLIVFPLLPLLLATAVLFEGLEAFTYALGGSLASALVVYALGRLTGRELVRRLASSYLDRLRPRLVERGVLAVAAVRLLPIAPFSLVNLVAGAIRVPWRDYVLGTALGLLPGITAITIFGRELRAVAAEPSVVGLAILLGGAAALIAAGLWLRSRAKARTERPRPGPPARASDDETPSLEEGTRAA